MSKDRTLPQALRQLKLGLKFPRVYMTQGGSCIDLQAVECILCNLEDPGRVRLKMANSPELLGFTLADKDIVQLRQAFTAYKNSRNN